jgi:hypothetical protein
MTAPMPKIKPPNATPLGLPMASARWPAKKDANAAGMRIDETNTPLTVEEKFPKVSLNCGMVVMEPIVPVSSLSFIRFRISKCRYENYPNSMPPMDIKTVACKYPGHLNRLLNEIIIISIQ